MTCRLSDTTEYGAFVARMRSKAEAERIPISGTLELTDACNLKCPHCYIRGETPSPKALSTQQWFAIFDKLAQAGCLWLGITGGEPLVRSDFAALYRRTIEQGFLVTLLTNATLVNTAVAELLADYPPLLVEVSLYGSRAEIYEAVTGVSGSFERCVSGIDNLLARGIKVSLKTTLTKRNVADLASLKHFAAERGLSFRFDGLLSSHVSGDRAPLEHRISAGELVSLEVADDSVRQALLTRKHTLEHCAGDQPLALGCGAGVCGFHVTYEGVLCPCLMIRSPGVDLNQADFAQAWNGILKQTASLPLEPSAKCYGCDQASLCSTCAGFGYLEHRDLQLVDEHLCDVARVRTEMVAPK